MAFGSDDVDIKVGVDTSGVTAGLASLRNDVASTMNVVKSHFASVVSFAGVTAGIEQVIEKMHEIHHEAERFGVDVEALQRLTVPAREVGVGMEAVARAMNLVTIAGAKATEGTNKFSSAEHQLNLNVFEFNALNAEQKIVAVAEAFLRSAKTAEDFTAVATLLGRRMGTELIPAFEDIVRAAKGGGANLEIFNREQVAAGEEAYKLFKQLTQLAMVEIGGPLIKGILMVRAAIVDLIDSVKQLYTWLLAVANIMESVEAKKVGAKFPMGGIEQQMGPGTTGGLQQGAQAGSQFLQDLIGGKNTEWEKLKATLDKAKGGASGVGAAMTDFEEALSGALGGGGGGAGGAGPGKTQLFEKFEAQAEEFRLKALDDEDRLNDLTAQRAQLQQQLDDGMELRNISNEEEANLSQQIYDLNAQILPLEQQIRDYKAQQADNDLKSANAINEKIAASKENVAIMQLEASGQKTLAENAKLEAQYNKEIAKARGDATLAYQQGRVAVGLLNDQLATQLTLERNISLAEQSRRQALAVMGPEAQAQANINLLLIERLKLEAQIANEGARGRTQTATMLAAEQKLNQVDLEIARQRDSLEGAALDLLQKRLALETAIVMETSRGVTDTDSIRKNEAAIAAIDAVLLPLLQQITYQRLQQANATARAAGETLSLGTQLQATTGQIGQDTAKFQDQSIGLQEKSNDLTVQIMGAEISGNATLAAQLRVQQDIVNQLAAQAQRQAAAAAVREGVGITPGTQALAYFAQHGITMGGTPDILARAMGFQPGTALYGRQVLQLQAEEQLRQLQGRNLDFYTQAYYDRLTQQFAAQQQQAQAQAAEAQRQQQIAYWSAIAAGRMPSAGFATSFYGTPNYATGRLTYQTGAMMPGGAAATNVQIQQLSTQIGLMQQQLTQLQTISQRLTPTPGVV